MILNTQIHKSIETVSGKTTKRMTVYYTDGTEFKTAAPREHISVALNSILYVDAMTCDYTISGGLVALSEHLTPTSGYAVYGVTGNFEFA